MTHHAINCHLNTRLHKRKEIAAETAFPILAKKSAGKFKKSTFQVGQSYVFVNCQPFYLIKHPLVSSIRGFISINSSWRYYPYRRGGFFPYFFFLPGGMRF